MKITKQNFIIPIDDENNNPISIWISHPLDIEFSAIGRVLSYINKEISSGTPAQCIITDYERLIDESLNGMSQEYTKSIKQAIETFFQRAELGAKLSDGRDFNALSKELKEYFRDEFRGKMLFISTLWRYLYAETLRGINQAKTQEEKEEAQRIAASLTQFFTLQNATEWSDSFANASAESQEQGLDTNIAQGAENINIKVSQTQS